MASTSKDGPVRIANKYEDDWAFLSDSEIELIKTEYNETLHDHFLSIISSEANSLKSRNCLELLMISIKIEEEKSRKDSSYINIYRDQTVESKDGKERLLIKGEDGKYRVFLPLEDIFDIFWNTHLKYCHPTTATLKHILQDDYIVNDFALQNIREVCYICSGIKKPYYRLALDIFSMSGTPDFAFTHIMICQDMYTGFIHLRPLSVDSKESEICVELLRIFMDFGPPKEIVLSSYYNIFKVALDQIKHLTTFAPFKITIIKVNEDQNKFNRIKNSITAWMQKNNFENWGIACYGVQLHLNNEIKGIRQISAYEKVFKKIENRVFEVLPEMDVGIDKGVSTTSPVNFNTITYRSGRETAEQASPGPSTFELITDEIIDGTESEFNAISDDEMVPFEDIDPLAIEETLNL